LGLSRGEGLKHSVRYAARRTLKPANRRRIRRSSSKLKHAITLFSSIIMLGTVLLIVSVIVEQVDSAGERAWNNTYNLSGAFEEEVRRSIDTVRGSMSLLKPRLAAEGAGFDLVDWIANAPAFAATTVQISFAGRDGMLVSSSLERHPKPVDLSDREHIRVHLASRRGLFIGKAVTGRVSGQVTIQISDSVENAKGEQSGVIVFSLSPGFLTSLHRTVRLGRTGSMILAGADGVIRAAFAGGERSGRDFTGTSISGTKIFAATQTADEGSYEEPSPLDGKPSFFHWRKVARYPLVVLVGLDKTEVFEVANRSAAMLAGAGAAVVLLTLAMTLILHREISRRVQREVALFDESRKVVDAKDNLQRRHRQLLAASAELTAERVRLQRLNKELGTAKELAEQANQAKSSLLMNMSHEFRTPMHAILNYTSMGLKKLEAGEVPKLKKYLSNIQISGARLLGMLNALLDLAKLESGKFDLRLSRGDLAQIIRQSQIEIDSLFESKQLRLKIDLCASDTVAVFDKQRMMQVFVNLFSNAIKFSPLKGTVSVTLENSTLPGKGPALLCAIADEGAGIPDTELETIFEKFTQSAKSANGAGSSGLGLAICREILHLHNGEIWATNQPSGGAVIRFAMPREPHAQYAAAAQEPAPSYQETAGIS
jgi:two-component system, NarL family, sensor histidine kinase BarA